MAKINNLAIPGGGGGPDPLPPPHTLDPPMYNFNEVSKISGRGQICSKITTITTSAVQCSSTRHF